MYEGTRKIKQLFPIDCRKVRTGDWQEVFKIKKKWEYVSTKAHTKVQENYCKRMLKAINIRLIEYKYKIFKEKGEL